LFDKHGEKVAFPCEGYKNPEQKGGGYKGGGPHRPQQSLQPQPLFETTSVVDNNNLIEQQSPHNDIDNAGIENFKMDNATSNDQGAKQGPGPSIQNGSPGPLDGASNEGSPAADSTPSLKNSPPDHPGRDDTSTPPKVDKRSSSSPAREREDEIVPNNNCPTEGPLSPNDHSPNDGTRLSLTEGSVVIPVSPCGGSSNFFPKSENIDLLNNSSTNSFLVTPAGPSTAKFGSGSSSKKHDYRAALEETGNNLNSRSPGSLANGDCPPSPTIIIGDNLEGDFSKKAGSSPSGGPNEGKQFFSKNNNNSNRKLHALFFDRSAAVIDDDMSLSGGKKTNSLLTTTPLKNNSNEAANSPKNNSKKQLPATLVAGKEQPGLAEKDVKDAPNKNLNNIEKKRKLLREAADEEGWVSLKTVLEEDFLSSEKDHLDEKILYEVLRQDELFETRETSKGLIL